MEAFILTSSLNRSLAREQELLEQQDEQRLDFVQQITKEKSVVFGQLAHDIGTPLAAINMAMELLEDVVGEQQRDAYDAVVASIANITVLRQAMLDYVKKANGALMKPSFDIVDINNLVCKKAFVILKQLLAKKPKVEPRVWVDSKLDKAQFFSAENWLLDMLLNFISNSAKFTEAGFIKISVRLQVGGLKVESDSVIFEVQDTGPGIPKHKVDLLYKEFSQLQTNKGGTGLGLSSVKDKAEILGGSVGFSNNEDSPGCSFFFALPFDQADKFSASYGLLRESMQSKGSRTGSVHLKTPTSRRIFCSGSSADTASGVPEEKESVNIMSVPSSPRPGMLESHRPTLMLEDRNSQLLTGVKTPSSNPAKYHSKPVKTEITSPLRSAGSVYARGPFFRISEVSSNASMAEQKDCSSNDLNGYSLESEFQEPLSLTVMIVDDSPVLLLLYKRMAEKVGIDCVLLAKDGNECLDHFFCNTAEDTVMPDFIFMDNQMPGLRGPQLAQQLAKRLPEAGLDCPLMYIVTGDPANVLESEFPDIHEYVEEIIEKPLTQALMKKIFFPHEALENPSLLDGTGDCCRSSNPTQSSFKNDTSQRSSSRQGSCVSFKVGDSFRLDTKALLSNHSDVLRTLRGRNLLEAISSSRMKEENYESSNSERNQTPRFLNLCSSKTEEENLIPSSEEKYPSPTSRSVSSSKYNDSAVTPDRHERNANAPSENVTHLLRKRIPDRAEKEV
eukprot:CAMPEP_0117751886 /NCGR_PEP_ID=MMETSP0947-20121206/11255_1 /TAXON_ID=44440 /ORGANISM="Chattonella subsalsa, Strain CCMP2191" /LENGTH=729 /DNA_ID=CAMNT_0005570379 /DNA_START=722 /DNA_END=2911 /DNA_ORIENTATION=+